MTSMRRNTVFLVEPSTPVLLQQVAAALGLLVTRGPGTGTIGSASRLLDVIAQAAEVQGPAEVADQIQRMRVGSE